MLSLQKNSFHFFHFPIFHSKIHKRSETFFERGYLTKGVGRGKWGTCKTNTDKKTREVIKNWKFRANVLFE